MCIRDRSNELKAQGVDVINLSVGEPDFNTPDHIKDCLLYTSVGVSDCLSFPAKINVALGIPGCMASPKARLSDICFSEAI